MAKIIIRRKKSFAGSAQNHDVYFMNTYVGVLKNGGELEVPVEVGMHTIYFQSQLKKFGSKASFTAFVNREDEVVELCTKFDVNGNYVIEYADNKPHLPTYISSVGKADCDIEISNNEEPVNRPLQGKMSSSFCCPRCGCNDLITTTETSTKGKDFKVGDALCGWLLCGPIGVLFGAIGKGKQINSTTYWLCKGCGNQFKM